MKKGKVVTVEELLKSDSEFNLPSGTESDVVLAGKFIEIIESESSDLLFRIHRENGQLTVQEAEDVLTALENKLRSN